MSNYTYKITNSNGMSGGVWSRSYDSRDAAAAAIAQGMGWDESVLSPSWSDDEDNSCWSAYETQEVCDADDTGAHAPTITRCEIAAISTAQIRTLRDEAGSAGDTAQVAICDRALEGDVAAIAECARVIANAAAQANE